MCFLFSALSKFLWEEERTHKQRIATKSLDSGTKKEPKPKLLSPDIFWWGGGLPREGVGAKKFGMSLETQGIKLFWRDIPGFCRDIPEAPEEFEKKMFGFNSRPLWTIPRLSCLCVLFFGVFFCGGGLPWW